MGKLGRCRGGVGGGGGSGEIGRERGEEKEGEDASRYKPNCGIRVLRKEKEECILRGVWCGRWRWLRAKS